MCRLDFAIFDNQGVTFRAIIAEDGSAVKGEVEIFGEGAMWICQETNP